MRPKSSMTAVTHGIVVLSFLCSVTCLNILDSRPNSTATLDNFSVSLAAQAASVPELQRSGFGVASPDETHLSLDTAQEHVGILDEFEQQSSDILHEIQQQVMGVLNIESDASRAEMLKLEQQDLLEAMAGTGVLDSSVLDDDTAGAAGLLDLLRANVPGNVDGDRDDGDLRKEDPRDAGSVSGHDTSDPVGVQLLNNVVADIDVLEFEEEEEDDDVKLPSVEDQMADSQAVEADGPSVDQVHDLLNLALDKAGLDRVPINNDEDADSDGPPTQNPEWDGTRMSAPMPVESTTTAAVGASFKMNVSESEEAVQEALQKVLHLVQHVAQQKSFSHLEVPLPDSNGPASMRGSINTIDVDFRAKVLAQVGALAEYMISPHDTAVHHIANLLSREIRNHAATRMRWVAASRGRDRASARAAVKMANKEKVHPDKITKSLPNITIFKEQLAELAEIFVDDLLRRETVLQTLEEEAERVSGEFGEHLAKDSLLQALKEGAGVDYKSGKVRTGIKRDKNSQDPAGQSKAIAKAISEQNQISAAISKRLMDPAIIAVNFQFLVDLAVLLSFATVVGLLCEMMKLPVVFSQVLTGMIVGPSGLNLLDDVVPIYTFAQFGSILFLLNFGLEHDISLYSRAAGGTDMATPTKDSPKMIAPVATDVRALTTRRALIHTVSHAAVVTIVLSLVVMLLGLVESWSEACLLALSYSICATAVKKVTQLRLTAKNYEHSSFQHHLVFMLNTQNILMGLLLAAPYAIATGMTFLYYIAVYAIVAALFSRLLSVKRLAQITSTMWERTPRKMRGGWIVASTLVGSLVFERSRMSLEFGAMFIGLVFTQSGYRERIYSIVEPLANVLGSIYFLCVGMVINIDWVSEHAISIGALVLSIAVAKFVTSMSFVLGFHRPVDVVTALQATTFLAPTGEFSLLFITRLKAVGLLSRQSYLHALSATAILIAFGPRVLRFLLRDVCNIQPLNAQSPKSHSGPGFPTAMWERTPKQTPPPLLSRERSQVAPGHAISPSAV